MMSYARRRCNIFASERRVCGTRLGWIGGGAGVFSSSFASTPCINVGAEAQCRALRHVCKWDVYWRLLASITHPHKYPTKKQLKKENT